MKTIKFKPDTNINACLYGETNGEYGYKLVKCPAMFFNQDKIAGYDLYIVFIQDGYRLIEYTTGITIGGSYPDKTANQAAKWFDDRIKHYGVNKIIDAIKLTVEARGIANN